MRWPRTVLGRMFEIGPSNNEHDSGQQLAARTMTFIRIMYRSFGIKVTLVVSGVAYKWCASPVTQEPVHLLTTFALTPCQGEGLPSAPAARVDAER